MTENSITVKTTSIARKINNSIQIRALISLIFFDILLILIVLTAAMADVISESGMTPEKLGFVCNGSLKNGYIYVQFADDVRSCVYISELIGKYWIPGLIILVYQLMGWFGGFSRQKTIRRKLKPLNDLAVKTEEISKHSFDMSKMENLEAAINHFAPDEADAEISTGDKDLRSIEVALNNLLHKMKESERRQARFVSDASHELRTPIAVVQGYVNMLDRWGKEDEEVLAESIEALKNETDHTKELVEQLLFLARGDNGRNTLVKEKINLNSVMQEVWEESLMIDENHKYEYSGNEEVNIIGDIAMIKQAMRIFLQNAAKYSNTGDNIKLSVGKRDSKAYFSIQDEGIGMADSDVVHIFERFYRSDSARNSTTGGSGLGLSIAKWIVDAHEGEIEVITRPEIGTRFTVLFDLQVSVEETHDSELK